MKSNIVIIIVFSIFFLLLEIFANYPIPKSSQILLSFIDILTNLNTYIALLESLKTIFISFFLANIIGLLIGSLSFFNLQIGEMLNKLFFPIQYMGSFLWTLIAIVIFGLSGITGIFILTMALIPTVLIPIYNGVKEIDTDLIGWSLVHTNKKLIIYRYVVFNEIIPFVKISMIRSFAVSWKIIPILEFIIGVEGIGFLISTYYRNLQFDYLFATIILILFVAILLNSILIRLLRGEKHDFNN